MKILLTSSLLITGLCSVAQLDSNRPFEIPYNLSDHHAEGNVKQITTTYEVADEKGELKKAGAYIWGHVKEVLKFNEQGHLTSLEYINSKGEAEKYLKIRYTKDQLPFTVEHKDLFSTDRYAYEYAHSGELLSITKMGAYDIEERYFKYDEQGRIKSTKDTKKEKKAKKNEAVITTEADNPTVTVRKFEYTYDGKSDRIKTIKKQYLALNEHESDQSGLETFNYDSKGQLISSNFKLTKEGDWHKSFRKTYGINEQEINHFYGDSLTDAMVYSRSKNYYDDKGVKTRIYDHYVGDGEFESTTSYDYKMDENGNWIEEKSVKQGIKAHSREDNDKTTYLKTRKISYFE